LPRLRRQLDGAIAFISGRPLRRHRPHFLPLKLPAVGGHGAEIRTQGEGHIMRHTRVTFDRALKMQFYEVAKIGRHHRGGQGLFDRASTIAWRRTSAAR
jgi:trehalose 6-phosphate phosphatase